MPTGRMRVMSDKAWLLAHVGELSDQQEAPYAAPWSTADAPASYLDVMARGIVGLTLEIARLEGKMKMSQNRDEPIASASCRAWASAQRATMRKRRPWSTS